MWILNTPMAKGGGGGGGGSGCHLFLQTKLLPVVSSLGHLFMKKFFKSDLLSGL